MSNYNFSLTLQAKQDIKDIWFHIAQDNIPAADNVIESFEQAFFKLTTNPNMGSIAQILQKLVS
ncbi:MAG: type II toxin-antitoxin system RelE/ParE family toxin [Rickettsia endosymbiont of Graphium doson]|nr:type II toxin-antitoxin system RelE/ParE family toxin [Rickettsia endosymbiont of Graphium doson]